MVTQIWHSSEAHVAWNRRVPRHRSGYEGTKVASLSYAATFRVRLVFSRECRSLKQSQKNLRTMGRHALHVCTKHQRSGSFGSRFCFLDRLLSSKLELRFHAFGALAQLGNLISLFHFTKRNTAEKTPFAKHVSPDSVCVRM